MYMTRAVMKAIVLLMVLSIGSVKSSSHTETEQTFAEEVFSSIGCTLSSSSSGLDIFQNIEIVAFDRTEYNVVRSIIQNLNNQIDELSLGVSQPPTIEQALPQDCSEVISFKSGIYTIQPAECPQPFRTFCDMETEGGGWTVIQRRGDGSIGFNRRWKDYQQGFGNKNSEYWLGNENLFWLTAQKRYELRVELTDFNDETKYAEYDSFRVGDNGNRYKLLIGEYRVDSTAGDALSHHNHAAFTTSDYDNDGASNGNCAGYFLSGWWYTNCFHTDLNGLYRADGGGQQDNRGIIWSEWRGLNISMKAVDMKIRPIST